MLFKVYNPERNKEFGTQLTEIKDETYAAQVTLVDQSLERNNGKVLEKFDYHRNERQCLDSSSGASRAPT
jgi:hypothetical protein